MTTDTQLNALELNVAEQLKARAQAQQDAIARRWVVLGGSTFTAVVIGLVANWLLLSVGGSVRQSMLISGLVGMVSGMASFVAICVVMFGSLENQRRGQ